LTSKPIINEYILNYIEKIRDIIIFFTNAIDKLNDLDLENAIKLLSDSIKTDTEADQLRRKILLEIERKVDDAFLKDYLAKLLRMLDRVSEWIKEASRYLDIIPYLEIPIELREKIEELSRLDLEAIESIFNAAKALIKGDRNAVLKYTLEAEEIEEKADEILHIARKNLVVIGGSIENPALIVMLRDFIEALENVTDYAEDVADILRLIALK